ncbi:MAG: FAD-binding oxidoreductase, partial [Prochlorococcaceae cyanobacterium]
SAPLVEQAPIEAPPSPQPRLLLSLASVGEQTLSEQIACITEKARGFGLSRWQELSSAELERLLITARGPQPPRGEGWLLRLGVSSSQVASLLASRSLRGLPAVIGAGGGLGYAWASAAELPDYRVEELRRRCSELGGYLTVLEQPAGAAIPAWLDAPSRPLIEAIKRQFDPKQQLARGRLPGVQPH